MGVIRRICVLVGLSVLVGVGSAALAGPTVDFHHDRDAGFSWAKVRNSSGTVIAQTFHLDAIPVSYGGDDDGEHEVPTIVLGELRDELAGSSDPEADEGETLVKDLMGPDANTLLSQISPTATSTVSYGTHTVQEHCGTQVSGRGECIGLSSTAAGSLCLGYTCKRTRILD